MIIYPYRDAIEAIQEIVGENKEAEPEEKRKLADACRDYLDWVGEDEEDEENEDDSDLVMEYAYNSEDRNE